MPPRTGPRRRKRAKPQPPPAALRLAIVRTDETVDFALAYRLELDDGHLVLRDGSDAVIQIVAAGEWREIRPSGAPRGATIGDIPYAGDADKDRIDSNLRSSTEVTRGEGHREEATPDVPENREQATLVNENDPVFQLTNPAVASGTTRKEEQDRRFVPSSPEEAQRILRELERRTAPDYRDPPDCESNAPPAPAAPRKD